MKSHVSMAVLAFVALFVGIESASHAQEAKGPTQFTLAILPDHGVSFVVPSALIVDERGRASGVDLVITNYTEKEQGFAIDKLGVKEVIKAGSTKTVKLSVTDLDAIGSDQSVLPYYSQLDKHHIGGLLYIKR